MIPLYLLVIAAVFLAIGMPLLCWLYVWGAERTLLHAHNRLADRITALEAAQRYHDRRIPRA